MIRIDLSRDGVTVLSKKKKKDFFRLEKKEINISKYFNFIKLPDSFSPFYFLLAGLMISGIPHVVFLHYKNLLIANLEEEQKELNENIQLISKEIDGLKPFQKEQESFEIQKKELEDKVVVIQDLLKKKETPTAVLDAIGESLPEKVWLKRIEMGDKETKSMVNIEGEALSMEEISDYVDRLLESIYIKEVTLETVTSIKNAELNLEVKSFKIAAISKE